MIKLYSSLYFLGIALFFFYGLYPVLNSALFETAQATYSKRPQVAAQARVSRETIIAFGGLLCAALTVRTAKQASEKKEEVTGVAEELDSTNLMQ